MISKTIGCRGTLAIFPNEIAIFHRDNDQQNHWVFRGTHHFQTHPHAARRHKNPTARYYFTLVDHAMEGMAGMGTAPSWVLRVPEKAMRRTCVTRREGFSTWKANWDWDKANIYIIHIICWCKYICVYMCIYIYILFVYIYIHTCLHIQHTTYNIQHTIYNIQSIQYF